VISTGPPPRYVAAIVKVTVAVYVPTSWFRPPLLLLTRYAALIVKVTVAVYVPTLYCGSLVRLQETEAEFPAKVE
jgi:hypothetical protein